MTREKGRLSVVYKMASQRKEQEAVAALPRSIQDELRQSMMGKDERQRESLIWIATKGTDVLSIIPDDVLLETIEHLFVRNGWIFRINKRVADRALARDLAIVKEHFCKPLDVKEFHTVLLELTLPAPDRHDRKLIRWAVLTQLLGVVVLFVLHKTLDESEHVLEWILLDQALALLFSAALVGECRHVDGRRWGRLMSGTTLLNLILTAVVIHIS